MTITDLGAVATARAIAARDLSVREVTEAHLARLDAVEPGLNAVVEPLHEAARARADALDRMGPSPDRPLHGLPVTIKINVDMQGHANSNGLPALQGNIAPQDAPVVANLLAAGAVPIGRTSTPEFSLRWFTSNPIYGVTLNPWDRALTPGGSSGGAAAAVAAGVGVLAHGNDLGGSLRYPAYAVGGATLRPSLGRVPAFAHTAKTERPATLAMMSVQGVIARSVAEVALGMPPLMRRSALDPLWVNAHDSGRVRHSPLRVGVAADPLGEGVDPAVAAAVAAGAEAARGAGYEVIEVTPPMMQLAADTWGRLLNAETSAAMLPMIREHGSVEVNRTIDAYAEVYGIPDLAGFIAAQADRLTCQRAMALMFDQIDALILPVSATPPFRLEQDFREPETIPDILRAQRPLFAINLLGLPGVSVRTTDSRPVPLGVQVVAAMHDDMLALQVAGAIETALGFDLRPIDPHA